MNKIFILIFFLIYVTSYGQKEENTLIKFNGVYTNTVHYDEEFSYGVKTFLRFYPSGEIIRIPTISSLTVLDIKDWFILEKSEPDEIGNYKLDQEMVTFYMSDEIEFKGKITKNTFRLISSKNLTTGKEYPFPKEEEFYFNFIRVADLKQ